ncbi:hypothetical protein LB505_006627 [Fusarium chuoi]|nr:hypothetical protein LB505_006627 [Fusarium chuoi]
MQRTWQQKASGNSYSLQRESTGDCIEKTHELGEKATEEVEKADNISMPDVESQEDDSLFARHLHRQPRSAPLVVPARHFSYHHLFALHQPDLYIMALIQRLTCLPSNPIALKRCWSAEDKRGVTKMPPKKQQRPQNGQSNRKSPRRWKRWSRMTTIPVLPTMKAADD